MEYGISQAGDKFGGKADEKSGDVIMKKLASIQGKNQKKKETHTRPSIPVKEESTDMILNRLISGNGVKRRLRIILSNQINDF